MPDLKGKCFKCSACGVEFDESPAVGVCRICEKVHCNECMTKEGVCVPCDELKS